MTDELGTRVTLYQPICEFSPLLQLSRYRRSAETAALELHRHHHEDFFMDANEKKNIVTSFLFRFVRRQGAVNIYDDP